MFLVTAWYGAFLLEPGEKGRAPRVIKDALFPKDATEIAQRLHAMNIGELVDEERALADGVDGEFEVAEGRLRALNGAIAANDEAPEPPAASGYGYEHDLLHASSLSLGRVAMRTAYSAPDLHVLQAVDSTDELIAVANELAERLREWYGIHFPEFADSVPKHEEFAAVVGEHVTREAIAAARPEYAGLATDPMGGALGPAEMEAMKTLARTVSRVYAARAEIEKYLDDAVPAIAPNLSDVLGPVLAARMIRAARGLRRLAVLPSGTIQTLGAEKALFRHLREGKNPPKHGILFQHPLVGRAARFERGPLARALAAKVALAARADAFTKERIGSRLNAELEKRAIEVRRSRAAGARRRPAPGGRPGFGGPPRGGPPRQSGPRGGGGGGGGRGGFAPRGGGGGGRGGGGGGGGRGGYSQGGPRGGGGGYGGGAPRGRDRRQGGDRR